VIVLTMCLFTQDGLVYPNFEVCEHWIELIDFLGPPWLQNTRLWEQGHSAAKKTAQRTNMRNITRDILIKVPSYPLTIEAV
jgi:hypothetical protein